MAPLHNVLDVDPLGLERSIADLQRRLDECGGYPGIDQLRAECRRLRTVLDAWPELVSAHVVGQLWQSVDRIRGALDEIESTMRTSELAAATGNQPGARTKPQPRYALARRPVERVGSSDEPDEPDELDEPDASAFPAYSSLADRFWPQASGQSRSAANPVALLPEPRARPITTEPYRVEPSNPLDPRLAVLRDPDGPVAEAYRSAFFRIKARSPASAWLVTTVSPKEDGAPAAANLALAVAQTVDEPVLLIEARFSAPRMAELFGFEPQECFGRRLAGHQRDPDAPWPVARLGDSNLHLLALAPEQLVTPALDATALADVIARFAAHQFAYVIVDAPPTTDTSDAPYLARCTDGVVIAMHAGITRLDRVQRARQRLADVPLLGYLLIRN